MNKMVKIDNAMNDFSLGKLTSREKDLFFAICFKAKDKGTRQLEIPFTELRELASYKSRHINTMAKDLKDAYASLVTLISYDTEERFVGFPLFSLYDVDKKDKVLRVRVSEVFEYMLNDWRFGGFTTFELREYTDLKSSYSKDLYTLLKQFRSTGKYVVKVDKLRVLLDVPEAYSFGALNAKVINPAIEELKKNFIGLNVEQIRKGRSVETLIFRFKAQSNKAIN